MYKHRALTLIFVVIALAIGIVGCGIKPSLVGTYKLTLSSSMKSEIMMQGGLRATNIMTGEKDAFQQAEEQVSQAQIVIKANGTFVGTTPKGTAEGRCQVQGNRLRLKTSRFSVPEYMEIDEAAQTLTLKKDGIEYVYKKVEDGQATPTAAE